MVGLAGALVLNIGTLSPPLGRGDAGSRGRRRTRAAIPVVLDPVGAGATRYRTETARRILDEVESPCCAGTRGRSRRSSASSAEVRGVESIGAAGEPAELARAAARSLGVVASVTGPVDHVSDGERSSRGRERPRAARVCDRHGLHVERDHRLLPRRETARAARRRGGGARRVRRRGGGRCPGRKGPGSFHVGLYDALAALDPDTLDAQGAGSREAARARRRSRDGAGCRRGRRDRRAVAAEERAAVDVVERGRATRSLCARSGVDVRRQRRRRGRAHARGRRRPSRGRRRGRRRARRSRASCSGLSATSLPEARAADGDGRLPRASGPSGRRLRRPDADPAIGLEGLREICDAISIPVVAIGGIDATNAADCIARRRRRRGGHSRGTSTPPRCGRRSMQLSEARRARAAGRARAARAGAGNRARRRAARGWFVLTQDALVEGVHFRLDWISWRDLGWRAAAVNLSDLAASGAEPEGLLVALARTGGHGARRRRRAVRGHRRDGCAGGRRRHDRGRSGWC